MLAASIPGKHQGQSAANHVGGIGPSSSPPLTSSRETFEPHHDVIHQGHQSDVSHAAADNDAKCELFHRCSLPSKKSHWRSLWIERWFQIIKPTIPTSRRKTLLRPVISWPWSDLREPKDHPRIACAVRGVGSRECRPEVP